MCFYLDLVITELLRVLRITILTDLASTNLLETILIIFTTTENNLNIFVGIITKYNLIFDTSETSLAKIAEVVK